MGPRGLKTTDEYGDCVYDWKNLTTKRAVYLGMGAECADANVHRFRLEDGSKLELLAFCWIWLDNCRGKTLLISHGDLTCNADGEEGYGPYLPEAMPAFWTILNPVLPARVLPACSACSACLDCPACSDCLDCSACSDCLDCPACSDCPDCPGGRRSGGRRAPRRASHEKTLPVHASCRLARFHPACGHPDRRRRPGRR